jgi:hypothetical protein
MSAHLSERTMMDVLEGGGSPREWAHVASCGGCRARLEEARAALELAGGADVPEPPGLYWEALRRNVGRRIDEAPVRSPRRSWLIPLAAVAAAAVVVAVSLVGRPPEPAAPASHLPAWSALPPVEEDDGLAVVTGLVEDELPAWDEGQGLGAFVAGLSDEESEALVAALRVKRSEGEL